MKAKRTGQASRLHVVGGVTRKPSHSQQEHAEAMRGAEAPATVEQLEEMQETHAQALSRLETLEGAVLNVARNLDNHPRGKGRVRNKKRPSLIGLWL